MTKEKYQLKFFTEYYQFYLSDKDSKSQTDSDNFWTPQASADRMAVETGLLGISVGKYAEIDVEINILETQNNERDFDEFEHIVEASIDVPSGVLLVKDCTGFEVQLALQLAPQTYAVRCYSAKLSSIENDVGDDFYVIEIWASDKIGRKVLRRFTGEKI
jgi:hypothetical protein